MEHVAGGDWLSWFKSVSLSLLHHAGRRASPTFLLGEEKAVLVEARFERTIQHAQVEVCTALEVVKEASSGRHVEQGAIPGGRLDTAGQRQGHQPRAEGWVVFKKAIVNISVVYGVMPPTRTVRRDPMPRQGDLFQYSQLKLMYHLDELKDAIGPIHCKDHKAYTKVPQHNLKPIYGSLQERVGCGVLVQDFKK